MANRVSLADMAWHTTVVEQEADGGTGRAGARLGTKAPTRSEIWQSLALERYECQYRTMHSKL
eukprot:3936289-Rhodomonas_salina.1